MRKLYARTLTVLAICLFLIGALAACVLLFDKISLDSRKASIERLDQIQEIYAMQAAGGIEELFGSWETILEGMAETREVVEADGGCGKYMELLYRSNLGLVRSVTRMDERGRILLTVPDKSAIGKDISGQGHVAEFLRTKKAVVSDAFRSVQGYDVIAMHVPVRDGDAFKGSLAITVDFQLIAKRFIEGIKIGETGYAWMLSRDGTELYCPVPGHTGRSVFVNCAGFPSVLDMAKEMIAGKSGKTYYSFDMVGDKKVRPVLKRAVYLPIRLGDTYWSIVVASSVDEALAALSAFRRNLTLIAAVVLLVLVCAVIAGARALLLIAENAAKAGTAAALEKERVFNRALVENSPAFIVAVGFDGRLITMNESMRAALGYTVAEAAEIRNVWDIIPESEASVFKGTRRRILAGEAPPIFQSRIRAKDGRLIECEWRGIGVRTKDGEAFMMGVGIDVTKRVALEERLRQSQKMESIGRLAGGVAHDFNNMLSVIIGAAEMAATRASGDGQLEKYVAMIIDAAERSATITRQLLAFSRRDAAAPVPLDLNRRVGESLPMLKRLLTEDVRLAFKPAEGLWTVSIDPSQLDQVVMNLAANARDAMPSGGGIAISTANAVLPAEAEGLSLAGRPGEYVELAVADSGEGMEESTIEHIFEPFFTTKASGRGTGLGLATVYGIATQVGGAIKVESAPGKGSVFRVFFPRCLEEARAPAEEAEGGEMRIEATVLVVEDEPMVLDAVSLLLAEIGCSVIRAAGPEEGLAACVRMGGRIDAVLTDVAMPGMNGKELAAAIRREFPEMKILFMSGYGTDVIAQRGMLEPGIDFIRKPLTAASLFAKLSEILRAH